MDALLARLGGDPTEPRIGSARLGTNIPMNEYLFDSVACTVNNTYHISGKEKMNKDKFTFTFTYDAEDKAYINPKGTFTFILRGGVDDDKSTIEFDFKKNKVFQKEKFTVDIKKQRYTFRIIGTCSNKSFDPYKLYTSPMPYTTHYRVNMVFTIFMTEPIKTLE